jgi:hypothetical protein
VRELAARIGLRLEMWPNFVREHLFCSWNRILKSPGSSNRIKKSY